MLKHILLLLHTTLQDYHLTYLNVLLASVTFVYGLGPLQINVTLNATNSVDA